MRVASAHATLRFSMGHNHDCRDGRLFRNSRNPLRQRRRADRCRPLAWNSQCLCPACFIDLKRTRDSANLGLFHFGREWSNVALRSDHREWFPR